MAVGDTPKLVCADLIHRDLAGDGGSDEAKETKKDAEMGVCGVHMACEAVEWRAWWTCIHVYRVRDAKVLVDSVRSLRRRRHTRVGTE
jgi:hypothetical protein